MKDFDPTDHYRSVEISLMKRMMRYREEDFVQDWKLAQAIAFLMADERNHGLRSQRPSGMMAGEEMIDSCFKRMEAYMENDKYARPF